MRVLNQRLGRWFFFGGSKLPPYSLQQPDFDSDFSFLPFWGSKLPPYSLQQPDFDSDFSFCLFGEQAAALFFTAA